MEFVSPEIDFIIIALGGTYPIKEELKSVGFRWNAANKVWYRLGAVTTEDGEYLGRLVINNPGRGIYLRCFEFAGNAWNEIQC